MSATQIDGAAVVAAFAEVAAARGWQPLHTPKNLACALAVEAGELLRLFQWSDSGQELTAGQRGAVAGEVADVLMYLLALCEQLGIDPQQAVQDKIAHNRARFIDGVDGATQ